MALCVVVGTNIYDEERIKRVNGETFEASQEWAEDIVAGDVEAERKARIVIVQAPEKKRGRPKKDKADENS